MLILLGIDSQVLFSVFKISSYVWNNALVMFGSSTWRKPSSRQCSMCILTWDQRNGSTLRWRSPSASSSSSWAWSWSPTEVIHSKHVHGYCTAWLIDYTTFTFSFYSGVFVLDVLDYYINHWTQLFVGLSEIIVIAYVYGASRWNVSKY